MDLRSIINVNNDATDSTPQKHPPQPVTPSHAGPLRQYSRDYAVPPPQASPYRHPSQDLVLGHPHPPPPYTTTSPVTVQYHTRPGPPLQLQAPSQVDLRSPASSSHQSAQSPYRHTPTSSLSGHQYPFPPNQPPPSPNHQISLQQQQQQHQRESYSHNAPLQINHNPYHSSSVPHTPPVATPGGSYPYPPPQQQRSQSSHSTSTPTSAQSQHPFYGQHIHDSPVSATGHPQHIQVAPYQHHQSQPGTPLGPPISIPRQSSGNFQQPQSPYSQRAPSIGGFTSQYPIIQTSPAPSQSPQISRLPSTPTAFEPHRPSPSDPHHRSQSERERSLSVSPRTRLPGQTRIAIHPDHSSDIERSRGIKREREDSVVSQPATTNGRQSMESNTITAATPSPIQPARKRSKYAEPPIWAQSWKKARGKQASPLVNSKQASPAYTNGKPISKAPVSVIDIPQSRPMQASIPQHSPPSQVLPTAGAQAKINAILGPWEPSILGVQPMEESGRLLADWFFREVVGRQDLNEIASQGIEIEIEAKLGTLIDKETNSRLRLPCLSECVLASGGQGTAGSRGVQWAFSSSMTEGQHKFMNDYLNERVKESYAGGPSRVKVEYRHRRERDRFYDIPRHMRKNLPEIMKKTNPNHGMKLRVTYDAQTGEEIAKIVKTRIADLDIYFPRQEVDCRVSINLEMTYPGDIEDLVGEIVPQRNPDRSKDRLSYAHSHYQFDLTQVTTSEGMQRTKEHELEIELSSQALREQGLRAIANPPQEHMYPQLVQGFLDNVRVLARQVPRVAE